MRSTVHLFDGYVATQGHVRARCSCGFLTTPQAAQRPARQQLVTGHGLTVLRCTGCGRGSAGRFEVGLPAGLTTCADPVTGRDRLVCAPGWGGCHPVGSDDEGQAAGTAAVTSIAPPRQATDHHVSTISTAVGVLMGRGRVDQRRARIRLTRQAGHLGISELEAAHLIVTAASAPPDRYPGGRTSASTSNAARSAR